MSDLVAPPPHVPTDQTRYQVAVMAACGMSIEQCARVLNVSVTEIQVTYAREFGSGADEANARVGAAILRAATDDRHPHFGTLSVFWARARMGWRDVRALDVKNDSDMPEAQKQKLIGAILDRLAPKPPIDVTPVKVAKVNGSAH